MEFHPWKMLYLFTNLSKIYTCDWFISTLLFLNLFGKPHNLTIQVFFKNISVDKLNFAFSVDEIVYT